MSKPRVQALYLDLIGGLSGDMFLAAAADLDPDVEDYCLDLASKIHELPDSVAVSFEDLRPSGGFGYRFDVSLDRDGGHAGHHQHHHHDHGDEASAHHHVPHVGYRDALMLLQASDLPDSVRERAVDIFTHLAKAEGAAHGVDFRDVHFHEVGGWDSIVDIVLAAGTIDRFGDVRWLCGPIPIGRGTIDFSHGVLPVPAPATSELLVGFRVFQDEFEGERVTPTGAAILRHLDPEQCLGLPSSALVGTGTGYGSRAIPGLSNCLRLFRLEDVKGADERVGVIEFEVDDQTPEDLALAIESLREEPSILDVLQVAGVGKKGRVVFKLQVLCDPASVGHVADRCLSATSSLGLRWYLAHRRVLERSAASVQVDDATARIKLASRPDGTVTGKVEADDLSVWGASFGGREAVRRTAWKQATAGIEPDQDSR